MPTNSDVILGSIVPLGLIEDQCIESIAQFIRDISKYLGVQLPKNISNVVISAQQPSTDQLDSLWIRTTNGGGFVGVYVFANGAWRQIWNVPNSMTWIFNDLSSKYVAGADPNTGFTLAWELPGLSADQVLFLKGKSHPLNGDPSTGIWTVFPVFFSGY